MEPMSVSWLRLLKQFKYSLPYEIGRHACGDGREEGEVLDQVAWTQSE